MLTKWIETNAQIRIYSVGIYLFKTSNINSRTRCKICSKLREISKRPYWHENIKKHWWRSDVLTVNSEQIPLVFLVFDSWIWESVTGWVYQLQQKGRDVNIMKHARAGTELCNINLKKTCIEFKKCAE